MRAPHDCTHTAGTNAGSHVTQHQHSQGTQQLQISSQQHLPEQLQQSPVESPQQSPRDQQQSPKQLKQQSPQQPKQQQQQQKAKKQRPITPEHQLLIDVQTAAKTQDPAAGITAYNRAIAEGINVDLSLYSVLLYLCSGGDEWERSLHQQLVETTPLVESIMQQAAADVAEAEAATAVAEDTAASSSNNGRPAVANGEQSNTPTAADLPAGSPGTPDATGGANTTAVDAVTTAAGLGHEGTKMQVAIAVVVTMSPAELHQAGRSIFDQMQVLQCVLQHTHAYPMLTPYPVLTPCLPHAYYITIYRSGLPGGECFISNLGCLHHYLLHSSKKSNKITPYCL